MEHMHGCVCTLCHTIQEYVEELSSNPVRDGDGGPTQEEVGEEHGLMCGATDGRVIH